jgi:hypothetical protein
MPARPWRIRQTPLSEDVVAQIAGLGPYFGFETDGTANGGAGWSPLDHLLDGSGALEQRYEQVRAALGGMAAVPAAVIEFRVAASVGHLGLASRLFCPTFGAGLFGYRIDLAQAQWKPVIGGVMPLHIPRTALSVAGSDGPVLDGAVVTLVEQTAKLSVSREVLWGNVASAVSGAVRTVVASRPELSAAAGDLAARVLSRPELVGTFTGDPGGSFRRRSCCLIYRIALNSATPGARVYCGDCVLG